MTIAAENTQNTLGKQSRRTIRRLGVLGALAVGLVLPLVGGVHLTHAAGTSDAAHACQQGGYLSLTGIDSTGQPVTFANEGQCVGFAAHGGFIPGVTACTVTSTTGCLTFNNATLPWLEDANTGSTTGPLQGATLSLTGSTSFVDTCTSGNCLPLTTPNALATGGGTYVEKDSTGAVISQGIYRVADTTGSSEGLEGLQYFDPTLTYVSSCAAGTGARNVVVVATLIDSSTGAAQSAVIAGSTGTVPVPQGQLPLVRAYVPTTGDYFQATVSSSAMSLTC